MNPKTTAIAALVIGLAVGFWFGNQRGYNKATADVKQVQEAAAKQAGTEAANAANPFKVVNPLEKVQTNPFEKAKQVLNPFQ